MVKSTYPHYIHEDVDNQLPLRLVGNMWWLLSEQSDIATGARKLRATESAPVSRGCRRVV